MTRPLSTPDVFKALADPSRRKILAMLADGEIPVSEIFKTIDLSQSACSQHLRVLREVDLVHQRQESTTRYYRLNAGPLQEVQEYTSQFERFWTKRLDRLGKAME